MIKEPVTLENLAQSVGSLTGIISTLVTSTESLALDVSTLIKTIPGLATAKDIENLSQKIETEVGDLAAITKRQFDELGDRLNIRIDSLERRLSSLEGRIGTRRFYGFGF